MSDEISNERLEMISKYDVFLSLGEAEAMARELLALRNAREGWRLVPVAPTQEILSAIINGIDHDIYPEGIYSDVLAASPAFLGGKSKPYGWIAEYPTVPAGIGGITYSFHDNRADAQEEADAYNGHVVEVVRR